MIDIIEEDIKGFDPLFDPGFYDFPFGSLDQAGNDIKREDLFDAFSAAVDGESDPLAHEQFFGQFHLVAQDLVGVAFDGGHQFFVSRADAFAFKHFIPYTGIHLVVGEQGQIFHPVKWFKKCDFRNLAILFENRKWGVLVCPRGVDAKV